MSHCAYCGVPFPKTRATRKYCTNRCKTNACLERKPCRIKAAEVQQLYGLLEMEFESADELRERLRAILAPEMPAIPLDAGRACVPRLD